MTEIGECKHISITSVKDRIFHCTVVHSDPRRCVLTITDMLWWRSETESENKQIALSQSVSFVSLCEL